MKTINVKGMGFGFNAVNAGQRNVTVEPQVIAVSTEGGFRLTPPVTRALGLEHGDYLMFISNVDSIDDAIRNNVPVIKEFCESNGLELGSPEASIAIHKEFDVWGVAKGVQEFDAKGIAKTCTQRMTKADKTIYVSQNFDSILDSALAMENEELTTALTREGITKEEQIAILVSVFVPAEIAKYKGSKLANTAGTTGIGTTLNCTDSNVWKQLKSDLENASEINREYSIDLDDIQEVEINDGFKMVPVKVLILGESVDKEPVRKEKVSE